MTEDNVVYVKEEFCVTMATIVMTSLNSDVIRMT